MIKTTGLLIFFCLILNVAAAGECQDGEGEIKSSNPKILGYFRELIPKFFLQRRLNYVVCELTREEIKKRRNPLASAVYSLEDNLSVMQVKFIVDPFFFSFLDRSHNGISYHRSKAVIAHELAHLIAPAPCEVGSESFAACEAEVDYVAAQVVGYEAMLGLLRDTAEYQRRTVVGGTYSFRRSKDLFEKRIKLLSETKRAEERNLRK